MKTFLITGIAGFVGTHFLNMLESKAEYCSVIGIDVNELFIPVTYKYIKIEYISVNMLNLKELKNIIESKKPMFILHLASFSSVAFSWEHPIESFMNNTNIFLNLLESVRLSNCKCRILSIGSSESYGNISSKYLPLKEEYILDPVSPYAVARVSQEHLSKIYIESFGLDIVLTRSFNHIGPGQDSKFVVAGFISRILTSINNKNKKIELQTGDLSIIRDFTDVRDVVNAYYLLLNKKDIIGEVFNICSGVGNKLEKIVEKIAEITCVDVTCIINPDLIRPNDNIIIIGDNTKIKSMIGWEPVFGIKKTIIDMIEYYNIKTNF